MRLRFWASAILLWGLVSARAETVRLITEDRSGITFEVLVRDPRFRTVRIEDEDYIDLRLKNFSEPNPDGYPDLPHRTIRLAVPRKNNVSLRVLRVSGKRALRLSHNLAYRTQPLSHAEDGKKISPDEIAYRSIHGNTLARLEEVSFAEADRLAVVQLFPFRYDAARRQLRWAKRTVVRMDFEPSDELRSEEPPVNRPEGDLAAASYLVLNSRPVTPARERETKIDLLIAHEDHRDALIRYVWFKRVQGREVREYYVRGQTNQQVKEIIKKEYRSSSPPDDTLLIGNIEQIPSWPGTGDCSYTDYPYQSLDSGNLPDIALGRVPAHNAAELSSFIAKSISRETEPRNNDQVLLTAGQDTSLGCPANVTVVGDKIKSGAPEIVITKKYRTQVGTEEVISAYNGSPNIIVYDGHGNETGMTEIPLLVSTLSKLHNSAFPLVLDIACLNASWSSGASSRNFAEMILLKPSLGAAGIMASGGSGYGHDFFQTLGSLMAQARKNLTSDPKANQIGRIIMLAKAKHGSQDRSFWNYYGDPASTVWSTP